MKACMEQNMFSGCLLIAPELGAYCKGKYAKALLLSMRRTND